MVPVVLREGDESIRDQGEFAHLREHPGPPRLLQFVEKDVVALQGHQHRHAQLPLQGRDGAAHEEIGEADQIRLGHAAEPFHETSHLLPLVAVLSLDHRQGQRAELLRVHRHGPRGDAADQARTVEPAVESGGQMPEERDLLLKENVDPSEEDLVDGPILPIDADGRVERQQRHLPAERGEASGEGIVPQATAAVHAAGTGGEVDDFRRGLHIPGGLRRGASPRMPLPASETRRCPSTRPGKNVTPRVLDTTHLRRATCMPGKDTRR